MKIIEADLADKTGECQPKLLTLKDISKIYSIPLSTLRRWASERRFPLFKVSNRILVSSEEFGEWLNQHKVDTCNIGRTNNHVINGTTGTPKFKFYNNLIGGFYQ